MIKALFFPGLLETGSVEEQLLAVCDGVVNFYVVKAPKGLICIDTGWRKTRVVRAFKILKINIEDVAAVFLTHGHWDHARCSCLYPNAEVYMGNGEAQSLFAQKLKSVKEVRGGQILNVAGAEVQVIGTPGHTSGSVSYLVEKRFLFTGDILRLRNGEILPFPAYFNNDGNTLLDSIRKLAGIEGVELLLTAHSGIMHNPENAFSRWREPDRLLHKENN